jgi:hypothetical protein
MTKSSDCQDLLHPAQRSALRSLLADPKLPFLGSQLLGGEMIEPDAMMERINAAIELRFGGDQDSARRCLVEIWEEISSAGNPI